MLLQPNDTNGLGAVERKTTVLPSWVNALNDPFTVIAWIWPVFGPSIYTQRNFFYLAEANNAFEFLISFGLSDSGKTVFRGITTTRQGGDNFAARVPDGSGGFEDPSWTLGEPMVAAIYLDATAAVSDPVVLRMAYISLSDSETTVAEDPVVFGTGPGSGQRPLRVADFSTRPTHDLEIGGHINLFYGSTNPVTSGGTFTIPEFLGGIWSTEIIKGELLLDGTTDELKDNLKNIRDAYVAGNSYLARDVLNTPDADAWLDPLSAIQKPGLSNPGAVIGDNLPAGGGGTADTGYLPVFDDSGSIVVSGDTKLIGSTDDFQFVRPDIAHTIGSETVGPFKKWVSDEANSGSPVLISSNTLRALGKAIHEDIPPDLPIRVIDLANSRAVRRASDALGNLWFDGWQCGLALVAFPYVVGVSFEPFHGESPRSPIFDQPNGLGGDIGGASNWNTLGPNNTNFKNLRRFMTGRAPDDGEGPGEGVACTGANKTVRMRFRGLEDAYLPAKISSLCGTTGSFNDIFPTDSPAFLDSDPVKAGPVIMKTPGGGKFTYTIGETAAAANGNAALDGTPPVGGTIDTDSGADYSDTYASGDTYSSTDPSITFGAVTSGFGSIEAQTTEVIDQGLSSERTVDVLPGHMVVVRSGETVRGVAVVVDRSGSKITLSNALTAAPQVGDTIDIGPFSYERVDIEVPPLVTSDAWRGIDFTTDGDTALRVIIGKHAVALTEAGGDEKNGILIGSMGWGGKSYDSQLQGLAFDGIYGMIADAVNADAGVLHEAAQGSAALTPQYRDWKRDMPEAMQRFWSGDFFLSPDPENAPDAIGKANTVAFRIEGEQSTYASSRIHDEIGCGGSWFSRLQVGGAGDTGPHPNCFGHAWSWNQIGAEMAGLPEEVLASGLRQRERSGARARIFP